uniref:Uncharacterized protein n=1 Tax=Globisporangium ultimum (strain ATCC 200006 / CBS 805.95 / DAOM BR144) TaxID=431595 RepID=K3WGA8_GLOUD
MPQFDGEDEEKRAAPHLYGSGSAVGGTSATLVRVGNATNGAVYSVALASNELVVEELREELVKYSAIPIADQILLGGPPFARLDPRRTIAHYGLPADDKNVFLYDRRMLSSETSGAPPPHAQLRPVDIQLPSMPVSASEGSRLLSESSSPLLRALADYESHFQLQVNQSQALEQGAHANIQACEACTSELQVQSQAIGAAIANLEIFKVYVLPLYSMTNRFTPFWSDFEASSEKHVRLLTNFESYLSALSTVMLHPALATDERKTLYDCIPVEREREWAAQCEQSHAHVRTQVLRLQSLHDEICREVTAIVNSQEKSAREYTHALQELQEMKHLAASQAQITHKLNANLGIVMNKIAQTSAEVNPSATMFASTNALEVCRGIDELYQKQHDLLPAAQKIAGEINGRLAKIASAKSALYGLVSANLRQISLSQSKIRDFENSLAMLKEALIAQKKHFNELEHLEKLPESYAACLKEIARRLKYGQMFSDRIQSMAEELAQLREEEVQYREVFLRSFGQHLPRDFVSGLAEKPSHCEFRMRPFDQSLPLIEDVDDANASDDQAALDEIAAENFSIEEPQFGADSLHDSGFGGSQGSLDGKLNGNGGGMIGGLDVELLQKRCEELEARVSELTTELEQSKKSNMYFGSESGSISRSDLSKTSAREGDSSCEFPLVLALAATAGAMTSSSEADRSNLLEAELASTKQAQEEAEQEERRQKELLIAKLEIQDRTRREQLLQDSQAKLQHTVQSLQSTVGVYRPAFGSILTLLQLAVPSDPREMDSYVSSSTKTIETRLHELLASADAEKLLRQELERRQDEEVALTSVERDDATSDSFKISFRSFDVNDLALFLPTSAPGSDAQRVYLAFHLGCPHRFLSAESISSFSINGRYPDYVVGRIVLIDEQVADDANNPYGLQFGTTFYVLTVASLHES